MKKRPDPVIATFLARIDSIPTRVASGELRRIPVPPCGGRYRDGQLSISYVCPGGWIRRRRFDSAEEAQSWRAEVDRRSKVTR